MAFVERTADGYELESDEKWAQFSDWVSCNYPDLVLSDEFMDYLDEIARANPQAWQNSRYEPYYGVQILRNADYYPGRTRAEFRERTEWLIDPGDPFVLHYVQVIPVEEEE